MPKNKIAIGIQSTVEPPESDKMGLDEWRLYLKIRNEKKIKLVKNMTARIDNILNQSLNNSLL